jgi:hypothetical protein
MSDIKAENTPVISCQELTKVYGTGLTTHPADTHRSDEVTSAGMSG